MAKIKKGMRVDFVKGFILEGCTGIVEKVAPEIGMALVVFDNPKYEYSWVFTDKLIVKH